MAILSIQSRVTSGYVGNAAALPILQRLGQVVWPIDTVAFSNHPAHGSFKGSIRPAAEIALLSEGLDDRGLFRECSAVLSGYLGSAETGPVVRDVAVKVKSENPDAFWCCDPVMGDNGRFYVAEGIPEFFRDQAIPFADIITPNAFEAAYLSGVDVNTVDDAVRAAGILRAQGPATVVITGIRTDESIANVAIDGNGVWLARAPFVDTPAHGAGDAFVALLVGHLLSGHNMAPALGLAVSGIHDLLVASLGADDLRLIESLNTVVSPTLPAEVQRLG